jgi:hypothetical protein
MAHGEWKVGAASPLAAVREGVRNSEQMARAEQKVGAVSEGRRGERMVLGERQDGVARGLASCRMAERVDWQQGE